MQFGKSAIYTVALAALIQFSPAPFLAAIPEAAAAGIGAVAGVVGAAGAVAGAVEGGIAAAGGLHRERAVRFEVTKRQQSQQTWNDCHLQLTSAQVSFSAPSPGNILVNGIPPACMQLVTVITGKFDEGNPVAQGVDSVLFQNVSDADIKAIQDALNAHPSNQK